MKKNHLRHALVALVSLAAISVSACNTVQGVGQDIESAGKKIEKEAK